VDIIRQAKARGVKITCETCPQYFTLTEEEVLRQGTMARVNPPLRTQADVDGIIQGLQDGTIDAIVTDHAPHSAQEKDKPLAEAPSGMVGLETSLALTLTELYHTGKLPLPWVVAKMSTAPALILGLSKGTLAVGADADLVIFDPDEEWTIDPEQFASKGRNTPFAGRTVKGKVKYTIAKGKIIYQEG
jgi:dihydroorotase